MSSVKKKSGPGQGKGGGRPSKFKDVDLKQVEKLAKKGWTDQEMADFVGISRKVWWEWKGRHEKFRNVLKEWKREADERVERSLYERAVGYSHPDEKIFCNKDGEVTTVATIKHYAPDVTAQIYWLKNRQPDKWRERLELSGVLGINLADRLDDARERVKNGK